MLPILRMVTIILAGVFEKATELLGQLVKKEGPVSGKVVTSVMDAVHVEGASWTIETMVADLVNGVMYLYYSISTKILSS